jgi:hypothetical protein
MMPQPQNQHGTTVCTNCNDPLRSVHVYKDANAQGLTNATVTVCLNCHFVATWNAVKPQ